MGWIADLFEGDTLPLELIPKISDLESKFAVLERENVTLKIKIQELEKQIAEVEGENQQLRKTREFHTASVEEETEPEQVVNNIEGHVYDSESGVMIRGAMIKIQNQTTKETYETRSNSSGHFTLPIPFGWYTVTISCDGYHPVAAPCFIRKEQRSYVDFAQLLKAPPIVAIG